MSDFNNGLSAAWTAYAAVNVLLASCLTWQLLPAAFWGDNLQGNAFIVFATLAHYSFFAVIIVFLSSLPLAFGHYRSGRIAMVVLFSAALLLMLIDAKVFQLYRFHINSMVINLMTGGEAAQILSFSTNTWGYAVACLLGVVGLQVAVLWVCLARLGDTRIRRLWLWSPLLVLMVGTQFVHGYADARAYRPITAQVSYIAWPQTITMKRFLRKMGVNVTRHEPSELGYPAESMLQYPKSALQCQAQSQYNIVLLVVDSLRFDMLNEQVTPNSYRFSQQAVNFQHHYSTGNATRFGIFGLLYGMPASYWFQMVSEQRSPVLIDKMQKLDYRFFIYGGASFDSPEFNRTAFANIRTLTRSARQLRASSPHKYPSEMHVDRVITQAFIEELERHDRGKPFFAFVFYDAPHNYTFDSSFNPPFKPYVEDVNYLDLNQETATDPFINRYKNAVYFDDIEIGKVLSAVEKHNQLEDTIVIITSDHGQEFNETAENYWGHNSNFSDYQVRVPLLVYWPNKKPGEFAYQTSHEDIVPTLLQDAFQCSGPAANYSTGSSLFDPENTARPLLLVNWSKQALLTTDRIYHFGGLENGQVRDRDYRIVDENTDPEATLQALEMMRTFSR